MKIYTIGFTKKSAESFFELLKSNNVRKVVDIRLNNNSQLAGFAKGRDLKYFLNLVNGIKYEHNLTYAPTKELLDGYKKKSITWAEYVEEYQHILLNRNVLTEANFEDMDEVCLLCSEDLPENCHRRLLAEEIQKLVDCEIIHLR